MANVISKDQIEQALLQRLQHVCGFEVLNCHTTDPADLNDGSDRKDKRDVLLPQRLKAAAWRLNPQIPVEGYDRVLFQAKCDNVFHLVLDHAAQGRKWAA
ncbi:hypothetical protein [Polaromonas sp. AER18D-145]|uniref:hypothetical protein n=1 Tax=Polaromonas sp. AER18D-145 TaxID=1977060 RepID=UPI000BBC5793|nr:hypothetical protein [Polaromonas sp. AER18D-145]